MVRRAGLPTRFPTASKFLLHLCHGHTGNLSAMIDARFVSRSVNLKHSTLQYTQFRLLKHFALAGTDVLFSNYYWYNTL